MELNRLKDLSTVNQCVASGRLATRVLESQNIDIMTRSVRVLNSRTWYSVWFQRQASLAPLPTHHWIAIRTVRAGEAPDEDGKHAST